MFPLSSGGARDEEMGEAAGLGAPGSSSAQDELEQALALAAAYFGGDPAVAHWAADEEGGAEPPPLAGLGLGTGGALDAEAELDALMGLPAAGTQQAAVQPPLDLDSASLGSADADDADVGSVPALGGAPAGAAGGSGPTASAAAAQLAQSVGRIELDDIDAEPADTLAPGGRRCAVLQDRRRPHLHLAAFLEANLRCSCAAGAGPLSVEAALAQGSAPPAAEALPPPIVPAPTDVAAAEADPLGALADAIEADKPKCAGVGRPGMRLAGLAGLEARAPAVHAPATCAPFLSWQVQPQPRVAGHDGCGEGGAAGGRGPGPARAAGAGCCGAAGRHSW